jgi:hypothetical protein
VPAIDAANSPVQQGFIPSGASSMSGRITQSSKKDQTMSSKSSKAFPNERKQPIPVPKDLPGKRVKRGIEPEEQHREGGNRVPDQGGRKPGAAKH